MTKCPPSVDRALYAAALSHARTRQTCADYARYESQKMTWTCANPGATPEQYEQAMRAIARACGV